MDPIILLSIVILIFSIVVHEVAHGAMANKLGDPTAKLQGRLTLNPLPHIDIIGSLVVPGLLLLSGVNILFGWAKPVPYNPFNLQGKFAELKVAIVGPISNIILAGIFGAVFQIGVLPEFSEVLAYGVLINCALAIFNLVPIPPLDGSKILFELLPDKSFAIRESLERSGFFLVILFVFLGWPLIQPIIVGLASLFLGQPLWPVL